MPFVDIPGRPLMFPSLGLEAGFPSLGNGQITLDADGEKAGFVFRAPKAGTINRVGFLCNAVAQSPANGLDVSLQTVDASGEPNGTADETRNVPTGDIASNTWVETGLITSDGTDDGTKRTVAVGELVGVVIDFSSFVAGDDVDIATQSVDDVFSGANAGIPYWLFHNATSWAKSINRVTLIFAVQYSDGTWVHIPQTLPVASLTGTNWSSASTPDEAGMIYTLPVPMRCVGAYIGLASTAASYALDVVLYDILSGGILGSASFAANQQEGSVNTSRVLYAEWDAVELSKDRAVRLVIKAGAACRRVVYTLPDASYRDAVFGTGAQYTSRTDAGAWTDSPTEVMPQVALAIDAIDPVKSELDKPPISPRIDATVRINTEAA